MPTWTLESIHKYIEDGGDFNELCASGYIFEACLMEKDTDINVIKLILDTLNGEMPKISRKNNSIFDFLINKKSLCVVANETILEILRYIAEKNSSVFTAKSHFDKNLNRLISWNVCRGDEDFIIEVIRIKNTVTGENFYKSNVSDYYGDPLIFSVCDSPYRTDIKFKLLNEFIRNGVDLEQLAYSEENGIDCCYTMLMHACSINNLKLVKILLKAGANPNTISGEYCNSAWSFVEFMNKDSFRIMYLLIEYGADIYLRNKHGEGMMYYLVRSYRKDKLDIEIRDEFIRFLMFLAFEKGINIVNQLKKVLKLETYYNQISKKVYCLLSDFYKCMLIYTIC